MWQLNVLLLGLHKDYKVKNRYIMAYDRFKEGTQEANKKPTNLRYILPPNIVGVKRSF